MKGPRPVLQVDLCRDLEERTGVFDRPDVVESDDTKPQDLGARPKLFFPKTEGPFALGWDVRRAEGLEVGRAKSLRQRNVTVPGPGRGSKLEASALVELADDPEIL